MLFLIKKLKLITKFVFFAEIKEWKKTTVQQHIAYEAVNLMLRRNSSIVPFCATVMDKMDLDMDMGEHGHPCLAN